MIIFTSVLFVTISLIFYTWLRNKHHIAMYRVQGDLEEPLNGSQDKEMSILDIFGYFFRNENLHQAEDTYLPDFLEDNQIDITVESSPVPPKFTGTTDVGFFVYKEENKPIIVD